MPPTRIVWLSDIRLNYLPSKEAEDFAAHVAGQAPDAVVVSGDIADSRTVARSLEVLARNVACPIARPRSCSATRPLAPTYPSWRPVTCADLPSCPSFPHRASGLAAGER